MRSSQYYHVKGFCFRGQKDGRSHVIMEHDMANEIEIGIMVLYMGLQGLRFPISLVDMVSYQRSDWGTRVFLV